MNTLTPIERGLSKALALILSRLADLEAENIALHKRARIAEVGLSDVLHTLEHKPSRGLAFGWDVPAEDLEALSTSLRKAGLLSGLKTWSAPDWDLLALFDVLHAQGWIGDAAYSVRVAYIARSYRPADGRTNYDRERLHDVLKHADPVDAEERRERLARIVAEI